MTSQSRCSLALFLLLALSFAPTFSTALRFTVDRKECFQQEVETAGDVVQGNFVIVKSDNMWSGGFETAGVDFIVEAPAGYHVYSAYKRTDDRFSFVAVRSGLYKFCFNNHSPVHEVISFDIHVGHSFKMEDVAKDEHFDPLIYQIQRLEDSATQVYYDVRWIMAQSERDNEIGKRMGRRLILKAVLQAGALIGASVLQVVLLRRLFERKFKQSRV
eukprot:jgi/Mesen1/1143/ME001236S00028